MLNPSVTHLTNERRIKWRMRKRSGCPKGERLSRHATTIRPVVQASCCR